MNFVSNIEIIFILSLEHRLYNHWTDGVPTSPYFVYGNTEEASLANRISLIPYFEYAVIAWNLPSVKQNNLIGLTSVKQPSDWSVTIREIFQFTAKIAKETHLSDVACVKTNT